MVVKVAEYSGTLNCKNCVIVPYTNTSNSNICGEKPNTRHCASQTLHQQQNDDESELLWHKQFTRWWSWNWRRKRTSLMKKLGKRHFHTLIRKKSTLTKNQSVECNFPENNQPLKLMSEEREIHNTIYTNSFKNGRLHQLNYDYEHAKPVEEFIPVFAKCSSRIHHTYKTRRRRNKHNERVYEGWMREICSSDTDGETDVFVKPGARKSSHRMHYLSLRLRKLNSDVFSEKSDETKYKNSEKSDESKYENSEQIIGNKKVSEYKSPISGKIYHLNVSKTQMFYVNPDETSQVVNAKSCTDKNFLARPEFACTEQYYKIRNEHINLLNSICEIVNKPTENKMVQSDFDEESIKTNKTPDKVEINSKIKESVNLYSNIQSDGYMPNISRSLPVFMQQSPQEINTPKNNYSFDFYKNVSSLNYSDIKKGENYYDINFIHNNLDVFKSSITETSFIWDYLEQDKK